jgi:hypothetical protein
MDSAFKGTGSPDGLNYFRYLLIDAGINKRRGCLFLFLKGLQRLSIEINLFLPVNANISWLIMVVAQFSKTDCRYAFVLVICRPFQRLN